MAAHTIFSPAGLCTLCVISSAIGVATAEEMGFDALENRLSTG